VNRAVSLSLVAVFLALPFLPMPQVCCIRAAARMYPCCPATASRAPVKVVSVRIDATPPAAAPRARIGGRPAAAFAAVRTAVHGAFWQPLATIQLRI
jgi:hypothetical protein